jgi:hypothetical protein
MPPARHRRGRPLHASGSRRRLAQRGRSGNGRHTSVAHQ